MCADKPNHHLQYEIGTDFCLEDPSKISTLLRIDCPLKREPLPKPIYEWTIVLNYETEVNLEASNLQSLGVHMFGEDNRNINLNATIALRNYTTIIVRCTVENLFGNDTETTTIDICSMLDIICIIKINYDLFLNYQCGRSKSVSRWCHKQLYSGVHKRKWNVQV